MFGGVVSNNTGTWGGGVNNGNGGTFKLSGGVISGNTAVMGGGVYNLDVFELSGDSVISGNTATKGGGVYNDCISYVLDIFGRPVSISEGSDGNYVARFEGKFNMTGGKILNNHATEIGGGVYDIGRFDVRGGVISANDALENNNVYTYNGNNDFYTDGSIIDENNELNSKNIVKIIVAAIVISLVIGIVLFFFSKRKLKHIEVTTSIIT
jgi:hypothetical protein